MVLAIPIIFLIVGIATLSDYGMNWDEPLHFMRGQAYLHFYLTGEKDYKDLLPYPRLSDECEDWVSDCSITPSPSDKEEYREDKRLYGEAVWLKNETDNRKKRSLYQHDIYTYNYFINEGDSGHPPANDIMAALSNYIFFQKLGVLGDIESYQIFEVFSAFLIVAGVAIFSYLEFGLFSSLVASFSLATYPLFFSESHFNIKDPVEASFFGLAIILFYFGSTKKKWYLMLFSSVIAGLALGTKFNALFLPFVVVPWLIFYCYKLIKKEGGLKIGKKELKKSLPLILSVLFYPVIVLVIFYTFWPYLWQDPMGHTAEIINYYRSIGTSLPAKMQNFLLDGWNTYPVIWILYTTPIPILLLTFSGVMWSLFQIIWKKKYVFLLVLLWFLVPIIRVSWPKAAIYGGVRQIMEFIPPMAILAGIGAKYLVGRLENRIKRGKWTNNLVKFAIVASLVFVMGEMIAIHPNENVYFNQLVGGLSGAKEKQIPSWGNSYGNVYLQGTEWINENAEPNARIVLPVGTMANISKLHLRSDIVVYNGDWSGPKNRGEYAVEMVYDWPQSNWYSYAYYDVLLEPIHEVKVDNVAILKIWKNDPEYIRKEFEVTRRFYPTYKKPSDNQLIIDLGKETFLSKVTINYSVNYCQGLSPTSFIATSMDKKDWKREQIPLGWIQFQDEALGRVEDDLVSDDNTLIYLFAAKKARYILIDSQVEGACIFKNPHVEIQEFLSNPD